MSVDNLTANRGIVITLGIVALFAVGLLFAFEPVTRSLLATDDLCTYCHLDREYNPEFRLSFSRPHPLEPVEDKPRTTCAECHMPPGFINAAFAYTHYASVTDLFGHFRDRDAERAGDWLPPAAARAHRVRERLFEYNSETCRVCHIEEEIKPKRKRGERAHKKALDRNQTCIECHDNMVHRYVALKPGTFQSDEPETEEPAPEAADDPFATDPFATDSGEQDPFATPDFEADPFATDSFDSPAAPEADPFAADDFDQSFDDSEWKE